MATYTLQIQRAQRRIQAMQDKVAYYENKNLEIKNKRIEQCTIMREKKLSTKRINAPAMISKLVQRKQELNLFDDIGEQTIIAIDLLEGLTENQKSAVNGLVKMGATPMGITVYTTTGDIYYFGKKVGNVQ